MSPFSTTHIPDYAQAFHVLLPARPWRPAILACTSTIDSTIDHVHFFSKISGWLAMNEAASITSFRSTRLESFRRNLSFALQKVLLEVSLPSTFSSTVNSSYLESKLTESISWKELCQHHDEYYYNVSNKRNVEKLSTPLEEIIRTLADGLPRACIFVAIKVILYKALLQSPPVQNHLQKKSSSSGFSSSSKSTRWSPSQELIITMITQWLNNSPSVPIVKIFSANNKYSSNQQNRLVSVVYTLAQDCPRFRSDMIQVMLCLIFSMDNCLINQLAESDARTSDKPCLFCMQQQLRKRPSKRIRYTLSDLHDDDLGDWDISSLGQVNRSRQPSKFSLKTVLKQSDIPLKANSGCTCHLSASPQKLVIIQVRAYKKLLKLTTSHHYPPIILVRSKPSWRILNEWMRSIYIHPKSPSIRLGLLFSLSLNQPQELAFVYWEKFLVTNDSLWLRFFTELVATSQYFDIPNNSWQAARLLWTHLLSDKRKILSNAIFCALAHLLHTRGILLQHGDSEEFLRLRNKTSVEFGQAHFWKWAIPQFGMALQSLEILGMVEIFGWEENGDEDTDEHHEAAERNPDGALSMWPFQDPYTMRGAFDRLSSNLQGDDALPKDFYDCMSSPTHIQHLFDASSSENASKKEKSKEKKPVPPLLDHLNADIQHHIIGFLDHVDLVRSRCVCTYWKSLIDVPSVWKPVYGHCFGPWKQISSTEDPKVNWMSLFQAKYLTEQSLKFQRNPKTTYKYRTCSYLGCLHVLKSQASQDKHEQKHVQDFLRDQQRLERQRTKQEEKEIREMAAWFREEEKREQKLKKQTQGKKKNE